MWDRRELLLAAVIFTALYCRVAAQDEQLLDMAENAVDDQYKGCREAALKRVISSGLLQQELQHDKIFQKAWRENTRCSNLIPRGVKEHSVALLAYINGDRDFTETFDSEVRTKGVNLSIYQNHFHFKSFHFLLMDYMNLQSKRECETVYVVKEYKAKQQNGSEVRLGSFTIGDLSYNSVKDMEDVDGLTILNITSCFFVKLKGNSCIKDKNDLVLLSPAEVFIVEYINEKTFEDSTYTEIVLKKKALRSRNNCYITSRSPADIPTQWLMMVLVALSLFVIDC